MLKIGDFSKAAQVTVKALRLYGELGLLRPVWVDRFSGYRYYSLEQLPRLNRILALKELGFSLEQVGTMLDRVLTVDELRSILRQKRVELEERLQAEQARLALLEARIEQIDQAGSLAGYEVALKRVPEQVVLAAREVVPSQNLRARQSLRMRRALLEELELSGVRLAGGWTEIVHNPAYSERNIDLEVALPVDLPADGRRQRKPLRVLAALAQAACLTHAGPWHGLEHAYAALYAWAQANGLCQAGPVREVCHADPLDGLEACPLVELQLPVEPLAGLPPTQTDIHSQKENRMELKLIEKPAFMAVGMKYVGKNENQEIAQMWGRFNQVAGAIAKGVKGCYGVCVMLEGVTDGSFEYLACFELDKVEKMPEWAEARLVPANTYAVFEHVGAMSGLRETYHNIYTNWLPQSGYQPVGGYDMEVYTDEFKDFAPESKMYIYVPVKQK